MQLVECLLHNQSLAILLCRLPNTSELHYTSLDSLYAAYQTPPIKSFKEKQARVYKVVKEKVHCDRTAQNNSVLSPKPVHVAIKQ
jgi:hypothetical protein